MIENILKFGRQLSTWLSLPRLSSIRWNNIIEILLIAAALYAIFTWVKNTRAWTLFKGMIVVVAFMIIAYFLNLTSILWIISKAINVIVICIFILFQPELRRALEQLGRKNIVASLFNTSTSTQSDVKNIEKVYNEIIKAVYEMSKERTGALIVMEKDVMLNEYERTGITIDAQVSSQLLINIFEHNTPLHDGAVFIKDNRIVAATCYLPLSDNEQLNKALGTRHRAAVGISEVSDSLTIVVSEETGFVSVAKDGRLYSHLSAEELRKELETLKKPSSETGKLKKLKGIIKNEKKANK